MTERTQIKTLLKSYLKTEFKVRVKDIDKNLMDKKLFIQTLTLLKEIEDRRDFMEEEIGLDPTVYEEKFLTVIENLFKMIFNKPQLALIQMYLYQLIPDREWDGNITLDLRINGEVKQHVFAFRTPEEVWNVIEKVK